MTGDKFAKCVANRITKCTDLLGIKATEYANDEDRLRAFKAAAAIEKTNPCAALGGMLAKHLVSIYDMLPNYENYSENRWDEKVITLRKLNYKNAQSVVVNPHRFGRVNITGKNPDVVNFVTVGAINPKRKNSTMIIDAVKKLHENGVTDFKVTVIGKGVHPLITSPTITRLS